MEDLFMEPLPIYEYGYLVQFVGTILLIIPASKGEVFGISINTQILLALATVSRLFYLTDSELLDHTVTYYEIPLTVISQAVLLYFLFKHKEAFYKEEEDKFINMYTIIGFSVVFSFLFHDVEYAWLHH